MNSKRKIIVIAGPTASGKTGWGVSIAKKFNGEIISADSRQVYKGLNIGTSKDIGEYGCIKYHLIDVKSPGEEFTLFDWLKLAREAVEDIFSRGKTPIIVGGTGLYIQALVEGFELEKAADRHPELVEGSVSASGSRFRNKFGMTKRYTREELGDKSLEELQEIVLKLKTLNLKLDLNNPRRLIRAIERAQSGEVITRKKPDFEVLQIAIDLPREVLYKRIDQGVEEWFEEGFIEEVQRLIDAGVDVKWLEKIGLEYRILTKYLIEKSSDFDEMKQRMKFAIHAYARRQLTWFRRIPEIIWCKDLKSAEKEIVNFLN